MRFASMTSSGKAHRIAIQSWLKSSMRHVAIGRADVSQPRREHPQQPRVLELQLATLGEHAGPELALAVIDR